MKNKIKYKLRSCLIKENKYQGHKIPTDEIFFNENPHKNFHNKDLLKHIDVFIDNKTFEKNPKQWIDVKLIVPTQKFLNKDNLDDVKDIDNKTNAYLVKYGDLYYIIDGHHRIATNIINGVDIINAYVQDVNKINENAPIFNKNNEFTTVFHGTHPKFVDSIKKNGLIDKTGYNQGWYMISTDFESALYHSNSDENDNIYVIEFKIPNNESDKWDGYPYLWKGYERNDKSTWFALKKPLPKEFIQKIHKVDYKTWLNQKNKKY